MKKRAVCCFGMQPFHWKTIYNCILVWYIEREQGKAPITKNSVQFYNRG